LTTVALVVKAYPIVLIYATVVHRKAIVARYIPSNVSTSATYVLIKAAGVSKKAPIIIAKASLVISKVTLLITKDENQSGINTLMAVYLPPLQLKLNNTAQ